MMVFVTGGAGSGKSAFAESLIVQGGKAPRIYIATMEPYGEEATARIARHRALRAGKGFQTVECTRNLAGVEIPPECTVLLEDLTNLFANEWFGGTPLGAMERVLDGLSQMEETTALSVVVGNDLFSDGVNYKAETQAYLNALAALNRTVAARSERVYEVVCGIPICHKGGAK